ncbi:MAG: hypothetical protein JXN64_05610 [Spirochaetes bacterium]|nr:hypothetical protein [Spirochaetota bacterium]
MKKSIICLYTVIIFFCLIINNSANASPGSIDDDGKGAWYIGFGIGSGLGYINTDQSKNQPIPKLADKNHDVDNYHNVTWQFGLGAIINSYFNSGIEISYFNCNIDYKDNDDLYSSTVYIYNYFLVGTYYPFINGLSFKIGGGGSTYSESSSGKNTSNPDISIHGYGFIAGIGYDFKLGKIFNLGLHLDCSKQFYHKKGLDDTTVISLYASFYWF